MPKSLARIIAVILVPCLVADPITVMGSIGPVGAGFHPRPQSESHSIQSIQIAGSRPFGRQPLQFLFTSQALAHPPVAGFTDQGGAQTSQVDEGLRKRAGEEIGIPAVAASEPADWTKPRRAQQRRAILRKGVYILPFESEIERQERNRILETRPFLKEEDYVNLRREVDALFEKNPDLRSFHRSTELVRDPQFAYLLAYWARRGAEDPEVRRWLRDSQTRVEVPDIPPSAMDQYDQRREEDHQYALLLKFGYSAHEGAAYWALKLAALNEADREPILRSLLAIRESVSLDRQKRLARTWPDAWGFRLWRGISGIERPFGGSWRSYIPAYHSNNSTYAVGCAKPAGYVVTLDIPLTDVLWSKSSLEYDKRGYDVLEFVVRPDNYRMTRCTAVKPAPAVPSSAKTVTEGKPAARPTFANRAA